MHALDDLLEGPITPYDDGAPPLAQQDAQACLAAGEAASRWPVAWLNKVADAFKSRAQGQQGWYLALPPELSAQRDRIEAEPEAWQAALTEALHFQGRAYETLIALGNLPQGYPRQWLETQHARHCERLLARFGDEAPAPGVLAPYQAIRQQRQLAWQQLHGLLAGELSAAYLEGHLLDVQKATQAALMAEAALQAEERQLPETALQSLTAGLAAGTLQYLAIEWNGARLPGAWVLTDEHAWAGNLRTLPLWLWVQGEGGGLAHFEDAATLCSRLAFTLEAPVLSVWSERVQDMVSDGSGLKLVPMAGGLSAAVHSMVDHWVGQLRAVESGQTLWPELTAAQALERVTDEARAGLAVPLDTARHQALATVERQWQADALVEHLPTWLLARDSTDRQRFAAELQAYHEAASRLEHWLSENIPPFPTFAGRLLAERIQQDLGLTLDPREPVLERPVSVTYHWFGPGSILEPSPEGTWPAAVEPHDVATGMQWVPSQAWEQANLEQLATENLDARDEAETERLKQAQWRVPGLSASYLVRTLPALDPLKQYKALLQRLLDPALSDAPERLRRPYELELRLQGLTAHWQGRLSEKGLKLLHSAAAEHDPGRLAALGVRVHWLVVQPGEPTGRNIEGCCALVAGEGGRTLLCMPGAPGGFSLLERDTLAHALDTLRDAIRTRDDMATYVAKRLGGDPAQRLAWFRQATQRGYAGYLSAPASLDQTLVAVQLHDRRAWLLARASEEGRSQLDILKARNLAGHHQYLGYLRAALAILPGVGTLIGLQNIYESAHAVAAGWRQQDPEAFSWALLGVAGGIVDVLLGALPVAGGLAGLRHAVRAHVKLRAGLEAGREAFAGYQAPLRLRGAVALEGRDAGTWLLNGEQYIWQDGRAYAVYRRAEEETLRLKATVTRRYQAPVRREGERWVIHAEAGLRGGGGKLTEAEEVFASWGPRSRHAPFAGTSRTVALQRGRRVLANYNFVSESRAREFAHAYLIDGTPPAWALAFRRGPGAAPAAVPPAQGWQRVRWNLTESDHIISGAEGGDVTVVFQGSTQGRSAVRMQGHYYPVIEGTARGQERFITPVGAPPRSLRDLDDLISRGEGPIRVRLGNVAIDPPEVLGGYTQTFQERLAERFPGLAADSRQALGEAVYRSADTTTDGLTHARLQALERFVADPHSDPLRFLTVQRLDSVQHSLTVRAGSEQFSQLRWQLDAAEHTALRNAQLSGEGSQLQAAFAHIITQRGYEVLFTRSLLGRHLCIFRRGGHARIHVLLQVDTQGVLSIQGMNGVNLLSDAWLDMIIARLPDSQMAATLRRARYQGHLDTLLGGIQTQATRPAALIWERVTLGSGTPAQPVRGRNWRHATRPLGVQDIETVQGSGLYRTQGQAAVEGVQVNGRLLPVYPASEDALLLLSRPNHLPSPLTFEALERCIRERFGEQPWLIARESNRWTVRRQLFTAPLDRQVSRARPGLTRQSALNVAHATFLAAEGSDAARLLHFEHALSSWMRESHTLGRLADPLTLLTAQRPTPVTSPAGWRLPLVADAPASAPTVLYLRPVEQYTQGLVAAVGNVRMRHHAANVIDDMLTRYGLILDHRAGHFAQYRQPSTNQVYLVALQVSESQVIEIASEGGHQVLSNGWTTYWRQHISEPQAAALELAMNEGRLIRLVATLRLDGSAVHGQVALQRLADF